MKFLTKVNTVLFFVIAVFIVLIVHFLGRDFCPPYKISEPCIKIAGRVGLLALLFAILTAPFISTLPLPPLAFERWKRFAVWGIPLSVILMYWIETSGSSGGLPGQFHPGIIFYPLILTIYFAISFTIILGAWYESKTNKKPRWWHYALGFLVFFALCASGLLYAVTLLI